MTDRWKDELKKLRGVEPPASLWDRAQEAPSADRLPPRRERIVAGVVAMGVFVAAGAFAFQALRPASRSTAGTIDTTSNLVAHFFVTENESGGEYPEANLTLDGQTLKGLGSSFCWSFDGGNLCSDMTAPDLTDAVYLEVPSGTLLRVAGDAATVEGFVVQGEEYPFEVVQNLGSIDDGVALSVSTGRYVLELTGHWPQGDRPFYFPIEIVEPVGVAAPRVTVTFLESDPVYPAFPFWEMSFGGATTRGEVVSFDWGDAIVDTEIPKLSDFVTVPQGADLVIEGEATSVDGYLGHTTYPFDRVSGLDLADGTATLDVEPDTYALVLTGNWPKGDVSVAFGIEIEAAVSATPSPGAAQVPDMARVVCDESGTQVLTPVVAAQSDGLHLVLENPSGAEGYALHPVSSERGTSVGGTLEPSGETKSGGFSLAPGEIQVACLPNGNDSYLNVPTASLTIEDPNGLWISSDPSCEGATVESSGVIVDDVYGIPTDELESVIREALVGLAEGDEVLKPGYPETEFKVINLVVRRDGAIVAHVWVAGGLHVEACEGSGIAAAPTPDIVLDCGAPDQLAFEHTGGVDEPAGEDYIRGNTVGVLTSDVLMHTGPPAGPTGDDGIWTVTREGSVVAWVDYPDLNGVACAGSGVGGVASS